MNHINTNRETRIANDHYDIGFSVCFDQRSTRNEALCFASNFDGRQV